jgi:type I restriction enzyme S subunit
MKRKGILSTENTENAEVDAVASVRSVVNTEDLPDGFQMTELGPLPEDWRVVRLGEVLERSFSGVWGEEPTVATKDDHYTIVRVIRVSDVEPNSQIAYAKVPFRAVRRRDAERCRLKPTDILVVKSSGSKTKVISGRSAIFEKDSDNVYIPANFLLALRPSKVLSEAHFVWYYLLTPKAKQWVEHVVEGSTYPNLNKAEYLAMPIPLPPLSEQRAIAHVLRTVQRAKEATEGVITALRELKKSLMQHLFTYGPVSVTERERVPLQETEIGPIPAHWRVVRLGEVVTRAFGGGTPSTNNPDFWGGTIPWTTSAVIQNDDVELCAFQRRITEEGLRNSSTSLAPKGSLLVGTRVGVGKAAVATFDVAISQDLTALILDQHVDAYFVAYLLKSRWYQSWFENNKRGATIKGVPRQDLLKLPIPLPPLDEQREIARILQAVDAKIAAEQARRAALEEVFKTLLNQLMTGKVRVKGFHLPELEWTP